MPSMYPDFSGTVSKLQKPSLNVPISPASTAAAKLREKEDEPALEMFLEYLRNVGGYGRAMKKKELV